jgi:hypothetical protein
MKTLNNSKVAPKPTSEFCFDFAALTLVDFLASNPHWMQEKCRRRLPELFFKVIGFQNATSSLKRVIGRIFTF